MVKELARQTQLFLQKAISIHSFKDDVPHREIIVFGPSNKGVSFEKFVIYDAAKTYSKMYAATLKDFFIIF